MLDAVNGRKMKVLPFLINTYFEQKISLYGKSNKQFQIPINSYDGQLSLAETHGQYERCLEIAASQKSEMKIFFKQRFKDLRSLSDEEFEYLLKIQNNNFKIRNQEHPITAFIQKNKFDAECLFTALYKIIHNSTAINADSIKIISLQFCFNAKNYRDVCLLSEEPHWFIEFYRENKDQIANLFNGLSFTNGENPSEFLQEMDLLMDITSIFVRETFSSSDIQTLSKQIEKDITLLDTVEKKYTTMLAQYNAEKQRWGFRAAALDKKDIEEAIFLEHINLICQYRWYYLTKIISTNNLTLFNDPSIKNVLNNIRNSDWCKGYTTSTQLIIQKINDPNIIMNLAIENDAIDIFLLYFEKMIPQNKSIEGNSTGKKFSFDRWDNLMKHVKPESKIAGYLGTHFSKPDDVISGYVSINRRTGMLFFQNGETGSVVNGSISHFPQYVYNTEEMLPSMDNFNFEI